MDKIKIHQKKIKGCNDSFFYDGLIATKGKYQLVACGDIEIRIGDKDYGEKNFSYEKNNFGELVFARGKHYCDNLIIKNDRELYKKVGGNYTDKLYLDFNNWFEVISEDGQDTLGDIANTYDEGIKLLNQYYKEKIYD